jgi:hypothetical protein
VFIGSDAQGEVVESNLLPPHHADVVKIEQRRTVREAHRIQSEDRV